MKGPTYFSRWRRYPLSCLGHTAQGVAVGLLMMTPLRWQELWPLTVVACVLAVGYFLYQLGSGARKAINNHHTDSIGWDIVDLSVGMYLALPVAITYLVATNMEVP